MSQFYASHPPPCSADEHHRNLTCILCTSRAAGRTTGAAATAQRPLQSLDSATAAHLPVQHMKCRRGGFMFHANALTFDALSQSQGQYTFYCEMSAHCLHDCRLLKARPLFSDTTFRSNATSRRSQDPRTATRAFLYIYRRGRSYCSSCPAAESRRLLCTDSSGQCSAYSFEQARTHMCITGLL